MKLTSLRPCMVNMAIALALSTPLAAVHAATPVATYTFNNTLAAQEAGAPALVNINPLGQNSFETALVGGVMQTVFHWRGNGADPLTQAGLQLNANGLVQYDNYSVELRFEFLQAAAYGGGWRRIVDTQNRQSDNGFYVSPSNVLQVYPEVSGTTTFITPGFHNVLLTNFVVGGVREVKAYLDGRLEAESATDQLNLDNPNNPGHLLHFFVDNLVSNAQQEYADGRIAYLRLYDGIATPAAPVPEPGSWMLLAGGLLALGWRRRAAAGALALVPVLIPVMAAALPGAALAQATTAVTLSGVVNYPDRVPGNTNQSGAMFDSGAQVSSLTSNTLQRSASGVDGNGTSGNGMFTSSAMAEVGTLHASAQAESASTPAGPQAPFPNGAARGHAAASFADSVRLYNPTLALGAPVAVTFTLTLDWAGTFSGTGGDASNRGGQASVFSSFHGQGLFNLRGSGIRDTSGPNNYSLDAPLTLTVNNGALYDFSGQLNVDAQASLGGSTLSFVQASTLSDASHTAHFLIDGAGAFTAIGLGGHNYAAAAAVPEPASALLFAAGLLALGRRRLSLLRALA